MLNKNYYIVWLILLLEMLVFWNVKLVASESATKRFEFPYNYRSAAFLGRGDTGIAVADDEDAIFYNPAGVARGKGIFKAAVLAAPMLEFSQSARDLGNRIGVQESNPTDTLREQVGVPQHFGGNHFSGLIMRRAALGGYVHARNTGYVYKDPEAGALESIYAHGVNDGGLSFSIAEDFGKNLYIGGTIRYLQRAEYFVAANVAQAQTIFADTNTESIFMTGNGRALDLGCQLVFKKKRLVTEFGLTINDVGNTQFTPTKPTTIQGNQRPLRPSPQTVNLGAAWTVKSHVSDMKFLVDIRDIAGNTGLDEGKKIHFGTELSIAGIMGVVGGINQGYSTGGIYIDLHFLRMDLGSYAEEVGSQAGERGDVRYYGRFLVGF